MENALRTILILVHNNMMGLCYSVAIVTKKVEL